MLVAAYEATLKKLGLVERDDPLTQLVAKKIIELCQRARSKTTLRPCHE
jgi:hypothetical protein